MRRLLLLALPFVGVAADATAQRTETDLGSRIGVPYRARIPDNVGLAAADRGRLAMQQFASCILDRSGKGVAQALTQSTEAAQNQALARLVGAECLDSGELRFKAGVMRAAIFTELYRRRTAGGRTMMVSNYDLARSAGATGPDAVYWWLMDFADCVVAKDRATASAFVVTSAVSDAETAALKTLTPSLGPCVTSNQQITLNRATIKGALAEALYRGAGPSVAPQGKK